jgi:hypothetical protein
VISANEGVRATVLAMNDADSTYEHPERVRFEIRQGVRGDYVRAADFVNYSDTRMVSIQHEYGIFGGKDGAYILDFLAELRKPSIATLHTVLDLPTASQRLAILPSTSSKSPTTSRRRSPTSFHTESRTCWRTSET